MTNLNGQRGGEGGGHPGCKVTQNFGGTYPHPQLTTFLTLPLKKFFLESILNLWLELDVASDIRRKKKHCISHWEKKKSDICQRKYDGGGSNLPIVLSFDLDGDQNAEGRRSFNLPSLCCFPEPKWPWGPICHDAGFHLQLTCTTDNN